MDHGKVRRSNGARTQSRIPQSCHARASPIVGEGLVNPSQAREVGHGSQPTMRTPANSTPSRQSFGYVRRSMNPPQMLPAGPRDANETDARPCRPNTIPISETPTLEDNALLLTPKLDRRKARPSLSERTIETLTQVSPAPSPTRRRSSITQAFGPMGPPARPASVLRTSQPRTPSRCSPSPYRPLSRTSVTPSSVSQATNVARRPEPSTLSSSDTMVSRIGRSAVPRQSDKSRTLGVTTQRVPKVKSIHDLRASATATRSLKNSPSTPLLRPMYSTQRSLRSSATQETSSMNSPSTHYLNASAQGLMSVSKRDKDPVKTPTMLRKPSSRTFPGSDHEVVKPNPSKSSASLRDTIAKAKAARKQAIRESAGAADGFQVNSNEEVDLSTSQIQMDQPSLRARLDSALRSGVLNLAAMSLTAIPEDVLHMYDAGCSIPWSETVDLRKVVLADNELTELAAEAFPDWSQQEMMDDAEKCNQFFGLEILDLHGNMLSGLPLGFRRLEHLKILNLSGNRFALSVFERMSDMANLIDLQLSNNDLTGVVPASISRLTKLQLLDLSNNAITALPSNLADCASLQKLVLNSNKLQHLDMSQIPVTLAVLDISNNGLSHISPADVQQVFTKLHTLDISHNSLQNLADELLRLPALETLSFTGNRFTTCPDLSGCSRLVNIAASDNNLQQIPDTFYGLTGLRMVDFSNNNIKLFSSEIIRMPQLSTFIISGNPLREKKYCVMKFEDIKVSLQHMNESSRCISTDQDTSVDLIDHKCAEGNKELLSSICPKGGILDLSSMALSDVDLGSLDLTSPVHTIKLANNNLSTFPIELLLTPSIRTSLRSLDLSHNPKLHPTEYIVERVDLPALQSLYIVSTGLASLDGIMLHLQAPELQELNISCHRLTGPVPPLREHFPALTTLLASDNWFESVEAEAIRGLEVLDLRNNEVESLPSAIGLLGNHANRHDPGRLRSFECSGNRFRVPRLAVIEKGTEAILRDLRRMIPRSGVPEEWSTST